MLDTIEGLIEARIRNARLLDDGLRGLESYIYPPLRPSGYREVYQLYLATATRRDELVKFLISRGVEAKVHYPVPIHLQKLRVNWAISAETFRYVNAKPRRSLRCRHINTLHLNRSRTPSNVCAHFIQQKCKQESSC